MLRIKNNNIKNKVSLGRKARGWGKHLNFYMLGDTSGSSEKEKHWQKQESSKLKPFPPQQDGTHFRHSDLEMINTKMPKLRDDSGTQENRGLDKYLGVISIWMVRGILVEKEGSGGRKSMSVPDKDNRSEGSERQENIQENESKKAVTSGYDLKIVAGPEQKN